MGRHEEVPRAPTDLPFEERLAWRNGYRQAIDDLLQIELKGGEVFWNGQVVHRYHPEQTHVEHPDPDSILYSG
jgi:hypothetical protein